MTRSANIVLTSCMFSMAGTSACGSRRREHSGAIRILARHHSDIGRRAGVEHDVLGDSYIDNLVRLGLLRARDLTGLAYQQYEGLKSDLQFKEMIRRDESACGAGGLEFEYRVIEVTAFGQQFCEACVVGKTPRHEATSPAASRT
ncbi:MAG: DUF4393 domain-containing protein [Armatimonadetes bacterium]|nr:DUF4393 domain-containing protein [Armatimonadota bacterium]NCO89767.1 DUF4393 domain-containing protein [Armatimonadota bacterium]NCQ28586.1 DUF4393 domain-containing protein [Armatimonadota bacterium]NDK15654.1 DUF4393 domain-containing protein [Armatimonadota bacterium]